MLTTPQANKPRQPSLREIREALRVTQPTAVTIRARGCCPAAGALDSAYWSGVAAAALAAGLRAPGLRAVADGPPPNPVPPPVAPVTPPAADGDDVDVAVRLCADSMRSLGAHIRTAMAGGQMAGGAALVGQFQKLAAEFRQLVATRDRRLVEMARLLPRDAVVAAASGLWITMRALLDRMVGQLTSPGHLPAWIAQAGGTLPDTRDARQLVQDRMRAMVEGGANELADALEACAVPEGVTGPGATACRLAMADELDRVAHNLRRQTDGDH